MPRVRLSVVLAVMILVATQFAQASPYLQDGGDPAHSGSVRGELPDRFEVGLRVTLPGDLGGINDMAPPLLLGDDLYLMEAAQGRTDRDIWRVNLTTGNVSTFYQFTNVFHAHRLVSDGVSLFGFSEGSLHAISIETGQLAWSTPTFPGFEQTSEEASVAPLCKEPVVAAEQVIIACGGEGSFPAIVAAMNRHDGAVQWCKNIVYPAGENDCNNANSDTIFGALSANDEFLFLAIKTAADGHSFERLSLADGSIGARYVVAPDVNSGGTVANPATSTERVAQANAHLRAGEIVSTPLGLVANIGHWGYGIDPQTMNEKFRIDLGEPSQALKLAGLGGDERGVFITGTSNAVYASPNDGEVFWDVALPAGDSWLYGADSLHGTDSMIVVTEVGALQRYDFEGNLLESAAVGATSGYYRMGASDGKLALVADDRAIIFGKLPAGISISPELSDSFPPVGAVVALDLSQTVPGVQAADLSYSISWGDGSQSQGSDSVFQHSYEDAGSYEVTVTATNSAGQFAIDSVHLEVGGEAPTWWSEAFSPDNQEITFFVLGIIGTTFLATVGTLQLRGKRARLRRLMRAASKAAQEIDSDPAALHKDLTQRRAEARELFMAGKLDEAGANVLERHLDELMRNERMSVVEEALSFLPHNLFASLQDLLQDATVSAREKSRFIASVNSETSLTQKQKGLVKKHVESWRKQDSS